MRNPVWSRLLAALRQALAGPVYLRGYWRVVLRGRDPLDDRGSRHYAGRWHNPKVTLALYFSASLDTSTREVIHHLEPPGAYEFVAVQVDVDLPAPLDLTRPELLLPLQALRARILVEQPFAQRRGAIVGGLAFQAGAAGILAPCMRGPDPCLCVYTGHPKVHVVERARLEFTEVVS